MRNVTVNQHNQPACKRTDHQGPIVSQRKCQRDGDDESDEFLGQHVTEFFVELQVATEINDANVFTPLKHGAHSERNDDPDKMRFAIKITGGERDGGH